MTKNIAKLKNEKSDSIDGPYVSRKLFGGVLDYDGAGNYPGIELLNLVFCSADGSLLLEDDKIKVKKRAHDFARRLVWDEQFYESESVRNVLFDPESEDAVRSLLRCLQLPIPNSVKPPGWDRAHFFPFTKSLVHWDARKRFEKIQIQRRYLRGGGALTFHVLRMDKNKSRLSQIDRAFSQLFESSSNSALEQLAGSLLEHGKSDDDFVADDIENLSTAKNDEIEDVYKNGLLNILEHQELTPVARIKALMNWTAFWLVLMQNQRAALAIGKEKPYLVCDCGTGQPQLRRASQRCLRNVQASIIDAVDYVDTENIIKKKQREKIRGFFWATAATITLINSFKGRRHFTLGLNLLETLVMAAVPHSTEIPFEQFVDHWLFSTFGLVVGRAGAEKSGQSKMFDVSVFEDNENHLATQMRAAGLVTHYSDATRMVGTGGIK